MDKKIIVVSIVLVLSIALIFSFYSWFSTEDVYTEEVYEENGLSRLDALNTAKSYMTSAEGLYFPEYENAILGDCENCWIVELSYDTPQGFVEAHVEIEEGRVVDYILFDDIFYQITEGECLYGVEGRVVSVSSDELETGVLCTEDEELYGAIEDDYELKFCCVRIV